MKLLEPITIGKTTLKNRIMFPPLSTGYEERDGSIGARSFNFYTRLAKGGVGYIVLGDVSPVQTISPTPRLYMDAQIESFAKLAASVHQYGAKLAIQIFHPEYDSEGVTRRVLETWGLKAKAKALADASSPEAEAVAKEAAEKEKAAYGYFRQSMVTFVNQAPAEEFEKVLTKMKECAERAVKAGVDGIQIHGDRLVGSLCSTIINKRTDEYGGSFENRIRFALKVTDAIRSVSKDLMIEYKLPIVTVDETGKTTGKGGLSIEEAVELAKILAAHGVDAFHVCQANHTGNSNDTIPAMGTREYAFMVQYVKQIKAAVNVPVSTACRVVNAANGESLIEQGICDYVAYGRSLLTDPDIAAKLAAGKENQIRKCMMCNKGCTDAISGKGAYRWISCVLNAENGFEGERSITKAENPRNVAVAGAGIAGLEAARVLALKGHHVDLYESSYQLGGQLNIACVPPRKEEMKRALDYFENVLPSLDITCHFGHAFTKEDAKNYKDIIVAVGAHNLVPHIEGIDGVNVSNAWDVLASKAHPFGKIAVMGGGLVGAETAEYLAQKGYPVTIIEMMDTIAREESITVVPTMQKDFADHHVVQMTLSKIIRIEKDGVVVQHTDKEGNVLSEEKVLCDSVVNALASAKNAIDLEGVEANILYVGDQEGDRPSNINHAIKSAYDAANSVN